MSLNNQVTASLNRPTKIFFSKPRRILLIYSKKHFDPQKEAAGEQPLRHSASNLARNMYAALNEHTTSDKAEIVYIDQEEAYQERGAFDLVIGILSPAFLSYAQKNPQSRKILFLVNCHPLWRLKTMIGESERLGKVFPLSEFVEPKLFIELRQHVDEYILIGNEFVRDTYGEYGIPKENINLIDSGVDIDLLTPDPSQRPKEKLRIVYPGSHLGIRKGLFRVLQAWQALEEKEPDFSAELVIMGGADKFKDDINRFVATHPKSTFLGWIESNTEKYQKLLQSSHIIINPSLEEGQVGCVLEAMATGAVPIITQQCGIAISDGIEGQVIENYENPNEVAEKLRVLIHDQKLLETMSQKSLAYIREHHSWRTFKKNIERIVFRA